MYRYASYSLFLFLNAVHVFITYYYESEFGKTKPRSSSHSGKSLKICAPRNLVYIWSSSANCFIKSPIKLILVFCSFFDHLLKFSFSQFMEYLPCTTLICIILGSILTLDRAFLFLFFRGFDSSSVLLVSTLLDFLRD